MFPTLHYLLKYLTGWDIPLPIPTFGACMALSFWAAYIVFTAEFRRKRALGAIPPLRVSSLMDRLLLACGIAGFAGAILFAKLDDTRGLGAHPLRWLLSYNGLTYFGALIGGALTYLYITHRRGISLAVAADIGSPGMMLAYGLGRIGCQLSGDGDWGVVNTHVRPEWLGWLPDWAWAYRYPHNVMHRGIYIPGCVDTYCTQLALPVYPTSLYESVVCLLLFGLLWFLRRRITRPGVLFAVYALLTGLERLWVESIRINPIYTLFGWRLTQAQWIALLAIGIGVTVLIRSFRKTGA